MNGIVPLKTALAFSLADPGPMNKIKRHSGARSMRSMSVFKGAHGISIFVVPDGKFPLTQMEMRPNIKNSSDPVFTDCCSPTVVKK